MSARGLGWIGIVRLGLVQTALGAIVVLTTSTLNRVMVVELALAASLPGALVALHYAIQILRPRFGHGSDQGRRRTPWIVGGMFVLAAGGVIASVATALMASHLIAGIALAVLAFILIGLGVGAAGTSLLVLLATSVDPGRRPAAATIVWTMMIAGFAVTATIAGHFLEPFSMERLIVITSTVAAVACVTTLLAVRNVEPAQQDLVAPPAAPVAFRVALAEVWQEPRARLFTIFVFVSMLGYSAQDLILEPFAGLVFAFTPGASTRLAGVQHGGVLLGMLCVALVGSTRTGRNVISMRTWTLLGCTGSAVALGALAAAGFGGSPWPLRSTVFALGFANGVFAVAAIGAMMTLAGSGKERREGVRMGLWGAAQAIAFGTGGLLGALGVDLMRLVVDSPGIAYASVFALEGATFLIAANLAARALPSAQAPQDGLLRGTGEFAIGLRSQ